MSTLTPVRAAPVMRRKMIRQKGLSRLEENRLRRRLRQFSCSEPWVDEQIKTGRDVSPAGDAIVFRYHDAKAFPPGGRRATAMLWCHECGRYTPPCAINLVERRFTRQGPVAVSMLQCDDCRCGKESKLLREIREAGIFPTREIIGSVLNLRDMAS